MKTTIKKEELVEKIEKFLVENFGETFVNDIGNEKDAKDDADYIANHLLSLEIETDEAGDVLYDGRTLKQFLESWTDQYYTVELNRELLEQAKIDEEERQEAWIEQQKKWEEESKKQDKENELNEAKHLGRILTHFREKAGLTQKQVAEKMGMTQERISQYETGYRSPNFKNRMMLARIYNCDIMDLDTFMSSIK